MALVPDIGASLGQTIFGAGGQPFSDPNRIPMSFTSLKRLRAAGLSSGPGQDPVQLGGANGVAADFTLGGASGISAINENVSGMLAIIEMMVNPNSITFKQPKRIVKRDTQEGSIWFHFSNSKGENNDILTIDFKGSTGNLDIRSDINTDTESVFSTRLGTNTGANKKLAIWHNLWQLTREPILLEDNTRNEFQIIYASVAIPLQIALLGHWSSVLEFSETADKPFSRDYTMSFTVEEVVPSLDEIAQLVQSFTIDTATTAGLT